MKPDEQPKGTFVILLVFMVILAASWIGMYLLMIARGGG
jgi:hypothetical protein